MNIRIDIGLFFFFVACAGVSIIVWIFNWICWLNQCCCCDFLHNPVNKRIAWWISFTFLLGMLACSISACVTINRFGFALDGALCSLDRIYYDFRNGTLKETNPRWAGFDELFTISTYLSEIENPYEKLYTKVLGDMKTLFCSYKELCQQNEDLCCQQQEDCCSSKELCEQNKEFCGSYKKLWGSLEIINTIYDKNKNNENFKKMVDLKNYFNKDNEVRSYVNEFEKLKDDGKFLEECHDYGDILFGWMKVLSMVYFCLFLITITLAGVAMMFYACLKRQGYLITIMHVLWNIIRFFMFSFFIFGAAYGIFDKVLKDTILVIQNIFLYENLGSQKMQNLVPRAFLEHCVPKESETEHNFAIKLINNTKLISELQNFYYMLEDIPEKEEICSMLGNTNNGLACKSLSSLAHDEGGIFGYFDCGFLENDLNMAYRALYDISEESEILSALSLTSSFFGAIAVYFYLLVLHHYNNELFFDSGKSIFRGFDGFGGGYKKKNRNQDPAYKKRKLRAEIELTSRNDEDNNYKDINKNEEDE